MRTAARALVPLTLLAALGTASCFHASAPPVYMQDVPKDAETRKAAIAEIEKELGDGFIVEQMHDIFFVASNDGRWSLDACKGVITRMYAFLTSTFFTTKPTKPLRVYLFKDKETYTEYVKKSLGREPSTPFGFYLAGERKMVMNIKTGTGTLAHELVHPLLAEDFPDVPSWFNEGFASLYEQSMTNRDGGIVGQVNWRLPALQRAIKAKKPVPLADLVKTNAAQFYGDNTGVNYSTARYVCYWLQEKELLLKFYKAFKETRKDDPTGRTALEKVTDMKLEDFEKVWHEYVMQLEWRR